MILGWRQAIREVAAALRVVLSRDFDVVEDEKGGIHLQSGYDADGRFHGGYILTEQPGAAVEGWSFHSDTGTSYVPVGTTFTGWLVVWKQFSDGDLEAFGVGTQVPLADPEGASPRRTYEALGFINSMMVQM